jgi:hypothetical protein
MSDSEEFERPESEEDEEESEEERESSEGSSDEAEFLNDQEVRDSQNEVDAQKVGRGSNARFADLQFVEVQQPADCAVFNLLSFRVRDKFLVNILMINSCFFKKFLATNF